MVKVKEKCSGAIFMEKHYCRDAVLCRCLGRNEPMMDNKSDYTQTLRRNEEFEWIFCLHNHGRSFSSFSALNSILKFRPCSVTVARFPDLDQNDAKHQGAATEGSCQGSHYVIPLKTRWEENPLNTTFSPAQPCSLPPPPTTTTLTPPIRLPES